MPFDQFTDQIRSAGELTAIIGTPMELSLKKELKSLDEHMRRFIAHSPFVVISTHSANGRCDASPRGDPPGSIHVVDENTLLIPDRPGNKRVDSFRNILETGSIGLLFLVPGVGETLRVNGRASITTSPEVLERFRMEGALPRSVIVVKVDTVFFQCSRALWRSKLWDPAQQIERASLPSLGTMVQDISHSKIKAEEYDKNLYPRLKSTLY